MECSPDPSKPKRFGSVQATRAAEAVSQDVRDPVVFREPLVHERIVGGQEINHIAVFAYDAIKKQLGFAAHGVGQSAVEVGILEQVRGSRFSEFALLEPQPLAREIFAVSA